VATGCRPAEAIEPPHHQGAGAADGREMKYVWAVVDELRDREEYRHLKSHL
jgi:hypothetical protein